MKRKLRTLASTPRKVTDIPALNSYLLALEHLLPTAVSHLILEADLVPVSIITDPWSAVIPLDQDGLVVVVRINPASNTLAGSPLHFWRKPAALRMLTAMKLNINVRGRLHKWPDAIRVAWSLISKHPCRKMSIREVATCLELSAGYLGARVEHILGSSFNNLLRDERVAAASRLLLESDARISEIPDQIGGLSIAQFNRNFITATGFTPTAYRNRFSEDRNKGLETIRATA